MKLFADMVAEKLLNTLMRECLEGDVLPLMCRQKRLIMSSGNCLSVKVPTHQIPLLEGHVQNTCIGRPSEGYHDHIILFLFIYLFY